MTIVNSRLICFSISSAMCMFLIILYELFSNLKQNTSWYLDDIFEHNEQVPWPVSSLVFYEGKLSNL